MIKRSDQVRFLDVGKESHYHFSCTSCGKVFELERCGIEVKHKLPQSFPASELEFFQLRRTWLGVRERQIASSSGLHVVVLRNGYR